MATLSMFNGIIIRMRPEKNTRHHKPHIHEAMDYYEMLSDAKAIDDHRVLVTFEGGQTGVFDCSGYFGKPYWRKLSDPVFFKCAHVSYGTLTWPEDIDIEPEEVWEDTVRTNSSHHVNRKSRPSSARASTGRGTRPA